MSDVRIRMSAVAAALARWACGGGGEAAKQDQPRDLSLAPAESTRALNDRPAADQPKQATQPKTQTRRPPPPPPKTQTQTPPPPSRPATPSVAEGTSIELTATDSLNSRRNKKGDMVTATTPSPVKDASGRDVIPAGAIFSGTISDIAPAEHPGGQGRMVLTFSRVSFGGKNYSVQARVDTLATTMKGRGVTKGDAAKVGAGAVVGGIAGRLLGGNAKVTSIGAAAGA